jgi:hypothetical protein
MAQGARWRYAVVLLTTVCLHPPACFQSIHWFTISLSSFFTALLMDVRDTNPGITCRLSITDYN